MGYKEILAELDMAWKEAEVKDNNFSPLPDGKYQVKVDSAMIDLNQEYNSLWLLWEMSVVGGQYEGRKVFHRRRLDDAEKIGWVKTDLYRAGIQMGALSELENHLPALLDIILEVQLKTGKPNTEGKTYQNCYINKRVDEYAGMEEPTW